MNVDAAPSEVFSAVVIGAGLAGLATVDAWREKWPGARLALVDSDDGQAGSRAPGALLHVSPGRSFAIDAAQADAFAASAAWLTKEPSAFVREQVLVRPNVGATGARLARSLDAARPMLSRAGVRVDVVSRSRLEELIAPAVLPKNITEGFFVRPSFAVALSAFISERRHALAQAGVVDIRAQAQTVARDVSGLWRIDTGNDALLARQVVLACGRGLLDFVDVDAQLEGGDLWRTNNAPLSAMVTGGGVHGCTAPAPTRDGDAWVVGATRYALDAIKAEEDAKEEMATKLQALLPLEDKGGTLWRGIRVVAKARRPVAQPIATGPLRGALAIGGFGATGLLWAPSTAFAMVERHVVACD